MEMAPEHAFTEAESYLNQKGMFGIKLGLFQIRELLGRLGNPQDDFKIIHIAGSNGKGSTAAIISKALESAGYRTGLYSSPHLVSVRERFRINGRAVPEDFFVKLIDEIRPHADAMETEGHCPTYFELTTAIAALHFAAGKVDFAVMETGMGGRLDATNVFTPVCSVISGISMEHKEYLGDSIDKIASEKAGIIKSGVPVFISEMCPEAEDVIRKRAAELESSVNSVRDVPGKDSGGKELCIDGHEIPFFLPGKIQRVNAGLSYIVVKFLSGAYSFKLEGALKGFGKVKWPGRFHNMPGGVIVDGAHNPAGAEALANYLLDYFSRDKFSIIFGNFKDKESGEMLRILSRVACEFIFIPLSGERKCRSPGELQEILASVSPQIPSKTVENLDAALALPHSGRLLACGSLYLAGEMLSRFLPEKEILDI
jgi:dihydrofolate synthase/folylpolyglutamate synthase